MPRLAPIGATEWRYGIFIRLTRAGGSPHGLLALASIGPSVVAGRAKPARRERAPALTPANLSQPTVNRTPPAG